MDSSEDDFDQCLRTGSIKKRERKLNTPKRMPKPVQLVLSSSDDDDDSLEDFFKKLKVTPKVNKVPVTPMRQFIVPDDHSSSDNTTDDPSTLFERTTITIDEDRGCSSDDSDSNPPLEDTVMIIESSDDEKENARPVKVRLPSGPTDLGTISSDDEVFNSARKNRVRRALLARTPTRTPDKVNQIFNREKSTATPEDLKNIFRGERIPSSPAEIKLRKEMRRHNSPVYKARKAEEERKRQKQNRADAKILLKKQRQIKREKHNQCRTGGDCIMFTAGELIGKQYQMQIDFLVLTLYETINQSIFKMGLPNGLAKKGNSYETINGLGMVCWNSRLRNTAGRCRMGILRSNRVSKKFCIELAPHILTSGQRLRDTFLHELIHAANWMIDETHKAGHGPLFKKWSNIAKKIHPEIPPVTTKHSYEINYKYWWECSNMARGKCDVKVGRKSRSLDPTKGIVRPYSRKTYQRL